MGIHLGTVGGIAPVIRGVHSGRLEQDEPVRGTNQGDVSGKHIAASCPTCFQDWSQRCLPFTLAIGVGVQQVDSPWGKFIPGMCKHPGTRQHLRENMRIERQGAQG